ncbi:MAG: aminoacyl-tRNA hydrolase [Bryobacteraceae bacterium]|nr:aminoacyl-tRNA hydrolase [Bryobacteraceae bacterium]
MDAAESSPDQWLVVGLGNPGPQYELTWHNLGFLAIDRLAVRNGGIRVTRPEARALVGSGRISGADVVLVKPQTFMNLSGGSVKPLAEKYEVPPKRVLLLYDELDLLWTGVRLRPKGSAGGHHGVESVIKSLGTQDFLRIRLGINPGHPVKNGADFVLSPIRKAQLEELDELLDFASQAVESIIAEGVEKAMTRFNRRAQGVKQEE